MLRDFPFLDCTCLFLTTQSLEQKCSVLDNTVFAALFFKNERSQVLHVNNTLSALLTPTVAKTVTLEPLYLALPLKERLQIHIYRMRHRMSFEVVIQTYPVLWCVLNL